MPIGKAVSIAIDAQILERIDALQPSHLTRKPFVNQLLLEALELQEKKAAQNMLSVAE